ncbi:unnamed protein product [Dicrocoelium dendriticum]|nr:unnamed protein product [Dicrocoelium dendriticum]
MNCVPCVRQSKKKVKAEQQRAELIHPVVRKKKFHRLFKFGNQTVLRSCRPSLGSSSGGFMQNMRRIFMPSRAGECESGESAHKLKTPGDFQSKDCSKNSFSSRGNIAKVRENISVSSGCDGFAKCGLSSQMLTVNRPPNFHWEYRQTKLKKLGFLGDPQVPDMELLSSETSEILQQSQLDEVMAGHAINELKLITTKSTTDYLSSPGRLFVETFHKKGSALHEHEVLDTVEANRTTPLERWPSELSQQTALNDISTGILDSSELGQLSTNTGSYWAALVHNKLAHSPIHHETGGNNRNDHLPLSKPQVFQSIGLSDDIPTSACSHKPDSYEERKHSNCAPQILLYSDVNSAHDTTLSLTKSVRDSQRCINSSLCLPETEVAQLQDISNFTLRLDTGTIQEVGLSTGDRKGINCSPFVNDFLKYNTGPSEHTKFIADYALKLVKQNSSPVMFCSKQVDPSDLSDLVDHAKVLGKYASPESRTVLLDAEMKPELCGLGSDDLGIMRGSRRTVRMQYRHLRVEQKQHFRGHLYLLPVVRRTRTSTRSLRLATDSDSLLLLLVPSLRRKQPEYRVHPSMKYYMGLEKVKPYRIPICLSISRMSTQSQMMKCRFIPGKAVNLWIYDNRKDMHDHHFRYGKLNVYSDQCTYNMPVELKDFLSAVKFRTVCGPQRSTAQIHYTNSLLSMLGKLELVRGRCVLVCAKTKVLPILNKPNKECSCSPVSANTEVEEGGGVAINMNSFTLTSESLSKRVIDVDFTSKHRDHDMKYIVPEKSQTNYLVKTTDQSSKTTLAAQVNEDLLFREFEHLCCSSVEENGAKKGYVDDSMLSALSTDEELLRRLVRNRLNKEGSRLSRDQFENFNLAVPAYFNSNKTSRQVFHTTKIVGRRKCNVYNGNMHSNAETGTLHWTNRTVSLPTLLAAPSSDIHGKSNASDSINAQLPQVEVELEEGPGFSSISQYVRHWPHFILSWGQLKGSLSNPFSVLVIFVGVTAIAPHFRRMLAWLAGVFGSKNATL